MNAIALTAMILAHCGVSELDVKTVCAQKILQCFHNMKVIMPPHRYIDLAGKWHSGVNPQTTLPLEAAVSTKCLN